MCIFRAIRYSGLGVRSVGPVGDFLGICLPSNPFFWGERKKNLWGVLIYFIYGVTKKS